ncbi:hypothetical protein B0H13DRAFT_1851106 [Mycena leptocephala]|nr:hypothetical protein B0H13DRAFT_1851106 [Mycena leptocephala]
MRLADISKPEISHSAPEATLRGERIWTGSVEVSTGVKTRFARLWPEAAWYCEGGQGNLVSERGLRGGDTDDEKEFRRRMEAGTWCVHEMLGAIMCQDAMVPSGGNSERSEVSDADAKEHEKECCHICKP